LVGTGRGCGKEGSCTSGSLCLCWCLVGWTGWAVSCLNLDASTREVSGWTGRALQVAGSTQDIPPVNTQDIRLNTLDTSLTWDQSCSHPNPAPYARFPFPAPVAAQYLQGDWAYSTALAIRHSSTHYHKAQFTSAPHT
jgi:hypothetical protein